VSAADFLCLDEESALGKVDAEEARWLAAFRGMDAGGRRRLLAAAEA
jgi:hypothetical protein